MVEFMARRRDLSLASPDPLSIFKTRKRGVDDALLQRNARKD